MSLSIEIYVVAVFVAAAIIGLAALPSRKGPVRTFLYAGTISPEADGDTEPSIVLRVLDNGRLHIARHAIAGVAADGAYSLAVKVSGFDVTIEERTVPGRLAPVTYMFGEATVDCLALERYHFQYRCEALGRSAAFSFNLRPGTTIGRPLV